MTTQKNSSLVIVNKIVDFIRKENLILKNKNILISLSGGQDSLSLLILFLQFENQLNYRFGSIYLIHFWNLGNIYKLGPLLKIGFSISKPIFFVLDTQKNFTEKKARIYRYLKSYRISIFYNYEVLLTGHTSTDQIETLLLNLFRGSSKEGITSLFINQALENKYVRHIFLSKYDLNM